ncbi:hypothetical protein NKI36_14285 [Mesorhizobium caraganae]|uniref:Uncharacterized protein n=1 Tax=Mesorhizobium caraganae TaxID=483206 RepID=A0ABV1YZQ9_9HYPH
MTGNQPYARSASACIFRSNGRPEVMPQVGLVEKFTAFRREMELLAAAEIPPRSKTGNRSPHTRRAHISMSFRRMIRHAGEATDFDNDL